MQLAPFDAGDWTGAERYHRAMHRFGPLPTVLLLMIACGGDDGGTATDTDTTTSEIADSAVPETADTGVDRDTLIQPEVDATPDAGPLDVVTGVWRWFDQPGSACSDGSETGFAVNQGTSDDVIVYFQGGGACWDFTSCFALGAARAGPFGEAEFAARVERASGVLDRDDPDNPFRTWSQVFVPYCTGDLHAGERAVPYTGGGLTRTWHHMGAVNVRLMLPRVAATFSRPSRLAVVGSSAGGFGATLQYPSVRAALMAGTSMLVGDSGPLLVGDAIDAVLRVDWYGNWRLDRIVDPICGQACKDDLSLFYGALAERFPDDRMALLSSQRDAVIAAYLGKSGEQLEGDIAALVEVLAPLPTFRTFIVAGDAHGLLAAPEAHVVQGVDLGSWLVSMVAVDAVGWISLSP